jgi:hypothetical protein
LNENGAEKIKTDTVLFAGGFKGNCRNCGKRGHKIQDCRAPGGGAYGHGNGNTGGGGRGNGGYANNGGRGNGNGQYGQINTSGNPGKLVNGGPNGNTNVICNYCKETGHMKFSCPKLAMKNGNGNGGNKDKANVAKTDAEKEISLVTVERYTKFSACDQCGEIGFHGDVCRDCYLGKYTESVTNKDLSSAEIGQCPHCGDVGFGQCGSACVACEDTGMMYESVDPDSLYPMDDEEEDEEDTEEKKVGVETFPVGIDCEWTAEIGAIVNLNYVGVFDDMTVLMRMEERRTVYMVKLFLRSVGGYFYPSESKEWIEQNFVHKYVFSLVALGVKTVPHLIGSVTVINQLLLEKGWESFSDKMLVYICAIGTVWIQAEYGLKVPKDMALVEYSYLAKTMRTVNKNLWIGDSGASCHMTCSLDGMVNIRDINSPVQVGSGESLECMKIGDKRLCAVQSDGTMSDVILRDCKYVPDLFTNLFSITKALQGGCSIRTRVLR